MVIDSLCNLRKRNKVPCSANLAVPASPQLRANSDQCDFWRVDTLGICNIDGHMLAERVCRVEGDCERIPQVLWLHSDGPLFIDGGRVQKLEGLHLDLRTVIAKPDDHAKMPGSIPAPCSSR